MPERHLSASKRKQQVSDLLLYISKFFCFLRDTAVSAFDSFCLSVFVRRSLGRIFAVAQMRTTAKHGFAAYSLEDSLQKENSRSLTCLYLSNFFKEIRPFPPLILLGLSVFVRRSLGRIFAVAQMRTTAKRSFAAYSLEDSLQKENSRFETCYTFLNFFGFCEIRPFPPLILLGLSMFARRSLGRIFAVAQMRTTAKPCFAAYSLEDSLQTKKEQARPVLFLFGAGNEIRTRDICLGKATLYH